MKSLQPLTSIIFCAAILLGCNGSMGRLFHKNYAHQRYQQKLAKADLLETNMGRAWLEASRMSLQEAVEIELPASHKGSFFPRRVEALAWRLQLQKGAELRLAIKWQPLDSANLFVDLFQQIDKDPVLSLQKGETTAVFEVEKSGSYILRLQPELFASGNFELQLKLHPLYAVFPISGKNAAAIQSFWGAPRDGGRRRHEGIDIFAPRGTPVLAPVKSRVSSVRERGLGGKQVWLRDLKRSYSLYFAHLDSQLVSSGELLNPGDTLGLVGNSGNARYTSPHLHFGVYHHGAFDPLPLVNNPQQTAPMSELTYDQPWLTVKTASANLRPRPHTRRKPLGTFKRGEVVMIKSLSGQWYQVESYDGRRGYLHTSLLGPVEPKAFSNASGYAYTSLQKSDSLQVESGRFKFIGHSGAQQVLSDSLGNVMFY